MMEFIKIPKEFNDLKELDFTERGLLAIYKYFTEKGYGYCTMKNEDIYTDWLNVSKRTFNRMKKHLKDLGYITVKGISVRYVGVSQDVVKTESNNDIEGVKFAPQECQNDTIGVVNLTHRGSKNDPEGVKFAPPEGQICTSRGSNLLPIKKDNKEIKKKIKMENQIKSIWEILQEKLDRNYSSEDKINYLKENHKDWIESIEDIEGYIPQIRNLLIKKFGVPEITIKKNNPIKKENSMDMF